MNQRLTIAALRMLDANANRAAEGLRTLEDLSRFVLNDQASCSAYKHIRHQLVANLNELGAESRITTRDVAGDVGTGISTDAEADRRSLKDVAYAAASRVEQSLRCIEECSKLANANIAARFEQLRYNVYRLNAQLLTRLQRDREFLDHARLYVLVDCASELRVFVDRVAAISEAGVDLIQLRDKNADVATLLAYLDAALGVLDSSKTRVIVNDRVDVAAASTAHGVHLGQTDLAVTASRKLLAANQWIGVSTHDIAQYQAAIHADVDYVGCGPTFLSNTKQFDAFAGLDYLNSVAAIDGVPAFAIGGINLENVDQVLRTGIKRVAVANAIWKASDPVAAATAMREVLG